MVDSPDYWRPDTTRPGAIRTNYVVQNITPFDWKTLFTITGRGMIFGGRITPFPTVFNPSDKLGVTIDESGRIEISLADFIGLNLTQPYSFVPHLQKWDTITGRATFVFPYGVYFDSLFKVEYWEGLGNTFLVLHRVLYGLLS